MEETFFEKNKGKELRVAMVGSGSWATALVKLLLNHQESIGWFIRNQKNIDKIVRHSHNPYYLQSVYLDPKRLNMSTDINTVIGNADIIVFCTPSAYLLNILNEVTVPMEDKFIVSAVKGFVDKENLTVAEYFNHTYGIPYSQIAVISGPCHAEEVAMERLSYLTISSKYKEVATHICDLFACKYIKTTPGTDIYGAEYAAALKNVYAIAAGICHGLNYGDNLMSVLRTNAYNEMCNFLQATHPCSTRVLSTSAYLGDLLVTGYSQFSRNRTFGSLIGKGYSVESILAEMNMVAEGYYATKCIMEINKTTMVDMPIANAVYQILYEGKYPAYVVKRLTDELH